MYCKSCGFEIENDSKYCRRCGSEVSGDISPSQGFVSDHSKKKISLIIAVAVALAIAAVSFILFFTMEDSPNSKGKSSTIYENLT